MPNIEKTNEAAAKSNISVADLYAELETTLNSRGHSNQGVSSEIRAVLEQVFNATNKDKLVLPAVVKICEQQLGKKKLYNIVRSVATSKSASSVYYLETIDGRTYIVRRG